MSGYDPYEHMKEFYKLDNPSEDEQFRFVVAMQHIIHTSPLPEDRSIFCYNLAIYYRNIKEFELEKKYLEIGEMQDDTACKEELGFIWYYGLCGQVDYKKAYKYFNDCGTRRSLYMISDIYHKGQYLAKNDYMAREIIEDLIVDLESEKNNPEFTISTIFPEVAVRLAKLNIEEKKVTEFDLDNLFEARDILALRQQRRPFWGNIKTMHEILDATELMAGGDEFLIIDLYDLLTFDSPMGVITFDYNDEIHQIDVFQYDGITVYQYNDKWYRGAEDFLDKAVIDGKKITTVFDLILDIQVIR